MRTRRGWLAGVGLGPWLAAALGCGGGGAETPPPTTGAPAEVTVRVEARGDRAVTARVGVPGGTLELANGARLEIPAGALGATEELTFSIGADTNAFDRRDDQETVGATLIAIPALASAGPAFRVSIPLLTLPPGFGPEHVALATEELDAQQRALGMGGTQTRWYVNPARIEDQRLVAELDGLTGQRLQFVVAR